MTASFNGHVNTSIPLIKAKAQVNTREKVHYIKTIDVAPEHTQHKYIIIHSVLKLY